MARVGKIARLPRDIRSQLNTRLQEGEEGKQLVRWLNSLPQVKALLADKFGGRPINEQNLTDWRQGGFEEWRAQQDLLAQTGELAAHRQEMAAVAPGESPADALAAAIAFRYGAILAAQGLELDEKSLLHLKSLGRTCHAIVKLRRSDQNAARLKIETERWELARLKILTGNEEELKRKQREALAAPIWSGLRRAERAAQFGADEAALLIAELLQEIETCPDPAHFHSKVLDRQSPEEWERRFQEARQNPPQPKTVVQAAAEMIREMDAALGFKTDDFAKRQEELERRLDRLGAKTVKPRPARRAKITPEPVQPASPASPAEQAPSEPEPPPQSNPSPAPPTSDPSAVVPPTPSPGDPATGAHGEIKPD